MKQLQSSGDDGLEDTELEEMDEELASISLAEKPRQPFRFFDLPSELRIKILSMVLLTDKTIDLDPLNYKTSQKRLSLFLASHALHSEASAFYYSTNTFRILPTHGRFFGNKTVPLLARLPTHYLAYLTSLELRLGPGWSKPPRSWRVDDRLGLEEMANMRRLKVFVELDPSQDSFKGFRRGEDFYTKFSEDLLRGVIERLPALKQVEIDGFPSVTKGRGVLMKTLIRLAEKRGKRVVISSELQWEMKSEGRCSVAGIEETRPPEVGSLCMVR